MTEDELDGANQMLREEINIQIDEVPGVHQTIDEYVGKVWAKYDNEAIGYLSREKTR